MITIRPGPWQPVVVILLGLVSCLAIAGAVSEFIAGNPLQGVFALLAPVVILLIMLFRGRSVRLEVTDSVVLAKQGHWRGHPDMQAPRNEIRAIHYFPRIISFRGPDKKPIMMIDSNYTVRQMVRVAGVLNVPMYDHTRWLGMRTVDNGRLVCKPESSQRVA
jgi:hypothetical protein